VTVVKRAAHGLDDETPPDYLTSVRDGGFYGWPTAIGPHRRPTAYPDAAKVASTITPTTALGGHTASLGLCWLPAGTLPASRRHGDRPARLV